MTENALVSIIIPVYNVEEFLDRAVESAVGQTYPHLEIILVDDGAKDRSGAMCDRWAERDSRIRVIHKENGGLSSARNAGLDVCAGDYIYFLDSDDYILENTIEIMLNDALEADADLVESSCFSLSNGQIRQRSVTFPKQTLNMVEALRFDLGAQGGMISACMRLYKRYLFDGLRFPLNVEHEDHYLIAEILLKVHTMVAEPAALYCYVRHPGTITTGTFTQKALGHLEAAKRNYQLISDQCPEALGVAAFRVDYTLLLTIDRALRTEDWKTNPFLPALMREATENRRRILTSRYMRINRKMAYLCLILNKSLYRRLVIKQAKAAGTIS